MSLQRTVLQALCRGGCACVVMTHHKRDAEKEALFRSRAAEAPFRFRIVERAQEASLEGSGVALLLLYPPSRLASIK